MTLYSRALFIIYSLQCLVVQNKDPEYTHEFFYIVVSLPKVAPL